MTATPFVLVKMTLK